MNEDYDMNESHIFNKNYIEISQNSHDRSLKSSKVFGNNYKNNLHSSITVNINKKEAEKLDRQDREEIIKMKENKKKEKLRRALKKEISIRLRSEKIATSGSIFHNQINQNKNIVNHTPHFGKYKNQIQKNIHQIIQEVSPDLTQEQLYQNYNRFENTSDQDSNIFPIRTKEDENKRYNHLYNEPNNSWGNSICRISIAPIQQTTNCTKENGIINNNISIHNLDFNQSPNLPQEKNGKVIVKYPKLFGKPIKIKRSNILTMHSNTKSEGNQKDTSNSRIQNSSGRNNHILIKKTQFQELDDYNTSKKIEEMQIINSKNGRKVYKLTRNRNILASCNQINNNEFNSNVLCDFHDFSKFRRTSQKGTEIFKFKNSFPIYKSLRFKNYFGNKNSLDSLKNINNNHFKKQRLRIHKSKK